MTSPGPLYLAKCAADDAATALERCLKAIGSGNLIVAEAEMRAAQQEHFRALTARLELVCGESPDLEEATRLRDAAKRCAEQASAAVEEARAASSDRKRERRANHLEQRILARQARRDSGRPAP